MPRDDGGLRHFLELFGLFGAPLLLAAIFGIVWTIINWKKASTPAIMAVSVFAILAMCSCGFPAAEAWVPRFILHQGGVDAFQRLVWVTRGIKISESLCWATTVVVLGVAVFLSRSVMSGKDKTKSRRDDDRASDDDDDGISEKPIKRGRSRDDD
jgi:hypothetical protein